MLTLAPDLTIERIVDMDIFRLGLDFLLPGATLDALEGARDWLAPWHVDFATAEVLLGVQSHLVRAGGRIILVDTCVGECKQRPRRAEWHMRSGGDYLRALAAAGVAPEDVDVVFCTHLHADHAGWNTRLQDGRWVPTFPNARYLVGRAEHRHWAAEEARAPGASGHGIYADSVLPILEAGLLDEIEAGADLGAALSVETLGLTARDLAGHSPGQMGVTIRHAGGQVHLCGDAVHTPAQLVRPDWSSRFCSDGALAARQRMQLFDELAGSGDLLIPNHLRGPLALRVEADPGGAWRPRWVG